MVPAKAKHGQLELKRAIQYWKVEPFTMPEFFPILTILVRLPLPLTKDLIVMIDWVWTAPTSTNIHKTHLPLPTIREYSPPILAMVPLQTPRYLQTGRTPWIAGVPRCGLLA